MTTNAETMIGGITQVGFWGTIIVTIIVAFLVYLILTKLNKEVKQNDRSTTRY